MAATTGRRMGMVGVDEAVEQMRMHALDELGLIDTPESESFDRITRMASTLLGAPVSAVSLTDRDRQWFKSHVGTAGREIPREGAPCAEVTRTQEFLYVPNMLEDARFADCPLARNGVRFYAGAPLTTRQGHTLGAMCVLDTAPRTLDAAQKKSLEDFAAMVMSQIELQHQMGHIDPATGLPNRHQMYDDLKDMARDHAGEPRLLLLVELADLRHVTAAVSVLGASYLDDLMQHAARVIRGAMRSKDGLYQVGFASLALVLNAGEEAWETLRTRLATRLAEPMTWGGVPVAVTAAYGVSPFVLGEVTPEHVLRTAVSAVHDAREAEMEYAIYSATNDAAHHRRFHLLTQVRESLDAEDHFKLVYQPRLDLATGRCLGAEALLRWAHPKLGNVSPGEFIPLVEQTALARPMTQWVLGKALAQMKDWKAIGVNLKVSINISARNLEEEDFAELVGAALETAGVGAEEIELEFTESALIRYQARVLEQLGKIRAMGIELAIDDFGTGYSSFAYLRQLPANTVKLDQSFMRSLATSAKDQTLVHSMIGMAHDIGYRVVGEGVETAEVLEILRASGCDEIQGYYIARPLDVAGMEKFLRERGEVDEERVGEEMAA